MDLYAVSFVQKNLKKHVEGNRYQVQGQQGTDRSIQRRNMAANGLVEPSCQAAKGKVTPYGTGLPQP